MQASRLHYERLAVRQEVDERPYATSPSLVEYLGDAYPFLETSGNEIDVQIDPVFKSASCSGIVSFNAEHSSKWGSLAGLESAAIDLEFTGVGKLETVQKETSNDHSPTEIFHNHVRNVGRSADALGTIAIDGEGLDLSNLVGASIGGSKTVSVSVTKQR